MLRNKLLSLVILSLAFFSAEVRCEENEMILNRKPDGLKQFSMEPSTGDRISNETLSSAANTSSSLRSMGLWLIVLGLSAGAIILARKRQLQIKGVGSSGRLNVVERVSLGTNREIMLIRACDRMLVVGANGAQMTLLSDLPTESSPYEQPFSSMVPHQDSPITTHKPVLTSFPSSMNAMSQQEPIPSVESWPDMVSKS